MIDETLTVVGSVPRVPAGLRIEGRYLGVINDQVTGTATGLPVISAATGRIYQFFPMDDDPDLGDVVNPRVGVLVRDGATLNEIERFLLPAGLTKIDDLQHRSGSELAHSLDTAGKRIFFWVEKTDAQGQKIQRQVFVLDEAALHDPNRTKLFALGLDAGRLLPDSIPSEDEINQYLNDEVNDLINWDPNELVNWLTNQEGDPPLPPTGNPPGAGQIPPDPLVPDTGEPIFAPINRTGQFEFQGITFSGNKLYLVTSVGGADAPGHVMLFELEAGPTRITDASGQEVQNPTLFDINWMRPVRGCRSVGLVEPTLDAQFNGFARVYKTPSAFYVPCGASGNAVVVKMNVTDINQLNGSEEVFAGSGLPIGYLVDEAGGRIHFRTHTPLGAAVLTFDTTEDAYVGLQAVSLASGVVVKKLAWGLDPVRGRIFTQTGRGDIVDGKPEEEPGLGLTSGRFTPVQPPVTYPPYHGPAQGTPMIRQLPYDGINRHLFLPDKGDKPTTQNFIVMHDEPPPTQPPEADPDSATKDAVEEPGKTGVNFSGNASGYGARELLVGGIGGAVPNRFPW